MTSFDWIDFGKLNGIEQDIRDILDQAGEYGREPKTASSLHSPHGLGS